MASISPSSEPTSRLRRVVRHQVGSFSAHGRGFQWTVMFLLSAILVVLLEALRLPAALLLGPMIAAIIVAAAEGALRVPRLPFVAAQAVIGCMIRPLHHAGNRRHDGPGLALVPDGGLLGHRCEQRDRIAADA